MNKAFEIILSWLHKRLDFHENRMAELGGTERDVEDWGSVKAYSDAIDIVEKVAEEYKGGWIPCSERLPEPNQKVIVSYMDRYIGDSYGVCEGQYVYILNSWDISDYMSDDDFEVIAWRPLPKPFKEEKNE